MTDSSLTDLRHHLAQMQAPPTLPRRAIRNALLLVLPFWLVVALLVWVAR